MKPGDYITNIDGETIIGMTLNEAVDKMRGKPGTKVKLTIRRVNEKPFDITLKREEIKTQSVKSDIKDNDVLYVRISSFSEDVANEVTKAFEKAKKNRKTPLKGIVLDVRNNPGGLLIRRWRFLDSFWIREKSFQHAPAMKKILKDIPPKEMT